MLLLKNLHTFKCTDITDIGLQAIAEGCNNISHIELTGSKVTDIGVKYLAEYKDDPVKREQLH